MGLDMYLYAERYIDGGWPFQREAEPAKGEQYDKILELAGFHKGLDTAEGSYGMTVRLTVGYWRKANQIHAWFVQNVQGGVDECQLSHVHMDQLRELRATCQEALERYRTGDPAKQMAAADLLPPQSGFFFGDTAIDDYYAEDLEHTVKQLDRIIDNPRMEACDLYYQSSW